MVIRGSDHNPCVWQADCWPSSQLPLFSPPACSGQPYAMAGHPCVCPPVCLHVPNASPRHVRAHDALLRPGKGGQCGLDSPDSVINSLLSNLIFIPTERQFSRPNKLWAPNPAGARSNLLPAAPPGLLTSLRAPLSDSSSLHHMFMRPALLEAHLCENWAGIP